MTAGRSSEDPRTVQAGDTEAVLACQTVRDALEPLYAGLRGRGRAAPSSAEGQLIRPVIALAGARALHMEPSDAFWCAAGAVQLAHEASLLHDDVLDGAGTRRALPTVAAERGVAAALVEGDHLLTTSYRLAAEPGSPSFSSAFARAVERTVAGEKEQGRNAGRALDVRAYRRVVAAKSGELLGCALAAAPLLAGSPNAPRWYALGRRIGTLYQMLDDFLDYLPEANTGKPPLADFRQSRWTWPLLYLDGVALGGDEAEVVGRFTAADAGGEPPLDRCHAHLEREARALQRAIARELPGDEIATALIDAWMDRVGDVVRRTRLAATEASLRAELERRVPGTEELDGFFRRNSRSFSFAARLFPADFREPVTRVYAFCRVTDDIADDDPTASPALRLARLDLWERLAARAHAGERTGIVLLDRVMQDAAGARVPFAYVGELIEGMRMDLRDNPFRTMAELRLYSYRVAGVVGQWLTRLCGPADAELLERAAALGHAMQLTNIIRDVGEDLRNGRVYLPDAVLHAHGFAQEDLHALAARAPSAGLPPAWGVMMEDLMARADRDYALAMDAAPRLPTFFRRAIVVAAHVYRGIHDAVRRNGYDNLGLRARTGTAEKAMLAARALAGRKILPAGGVQEDTAQEEAPVSTAAPSSSRRRIPPRAALFGVLLAAGALAAPGRGSFAAAQQQPPTGSGVVGQAAAVGPGRSGDAPTPGGVAGGGASPPGAARMPPAAHLIRLDSAVALAPTDAELHLDRVRALFLAGVEDRRAVNLGHAAVRELRERFGPFSALHAPLLLAYDGAFHTLDGKHGFWPHNRLLAVRTGLDRLDRAVEAAPQHPEVRYLRLVTTFHLPGLFGRGDSARDDLRVLADLLLNAPERPPEPLLSVISEFVEANGG